MAIAKSPLSLTSSLKVVHDTDSDGTIEADINGGAATLYLIKIDNTANASQAVFTKLWNATGPTIAVTVPDFIIRVPGGATVSMAIPEGISMATGLSFATVTAGGTTGSTNPTSDVIVDIVFA